MTVNFHPRGALGLGSANTSRMTRRTADQMGAHHLGFTQHHVGDGGLLFHPNPITRLQRIWEYHVHTLGYGDIAYEGAFDADGNTFGLRDSTFVGAHAKSTGNIANVLTDGICFLEDRRGITAGALEAFEWWANLYRFTHRHAPTLYAHEYWAKGHGGTPTACPGDDWVRVVRFVGGFT